MTREEEEKEIEATKAPLIEHLIELRSRLIKALLAFAVAFVACFFFAKTIFELCGMNVDLTPITTAQSGSKARRPAFSVLGHGKWMAAGFAELRPWRAALADYLRAKGHLAQ